jgi:hypothetical protein
MSVTGHKSVSSLAIYQRTSDQKKIQMGTILNSAMTGENNNNNALPSCRHYPALPAPHSQIMLRTSQSQSQRQLEFQNQVTGINLKHNSYGHDIQLLIVNCDIYGADITTVKYWKLRNGIKITHDIIKIDSRHLILEF